MGIKLKFYLKEHHKTNLTEYLVSKKDKSNFMDWITDKFVDYLVTISSTIEQTTISGFMEARNNITGKLISKTPFTQASMDHVKIVHDKKFKPDGDNWKMYIFEVLERTNAALENAYKFHIISNTELKLKYTKSVEELFHTVMLNSVSSIMSENLKTTLKDEFKQLKKAKTEEKEATEPKKPKKKNKSKA